MPQADTYHDTVVNALVADGWTITHDPLTLTYQGKDVFVDLGAEKTIAAERNGTRIAVEIKSFLHPSDVQDLKLALGGYSLYRDLLQELEPDRTLYLAVPEHAWTGIFSHPVGQLVRERENLKLIVFDPEQQRITRWLT